MVGHLNGARYKKLVDVPENANDCWNWIGSVSKTTGYGKKQYQGKSVLAHRWTWTMLFGRIPDGKVLNHKCSNRRCVNPTHLEVTDTAGNCRHGKSTKLNEDAVRKIRAAKRASKRGETRRVLSQTYRVSPQTISDIWADRSWRGI